jgi:hypothetical protein
MNERNDCIKNDKYILSTMIAGVFQYW